MNHSGESHAENGGTATGTTASKNAIGNKNEPDEQALLASMDAYLLEQNVYEKDVLRQASYLTVPQLLLSDDANRNNDEAHDDDHSYSAALPRQLPGFPSSMTAELLQPFHHHHHHHEKQPHSLVKSSKRGNHMMDTALASNVLQSILDQVRRHEPPPPPPRSHVVDGDKFNALDLHHMKEQILLHLLETIGSTLPLSSHRQPNDGRSSSTFTTTQPPPASKPAMERGQHRSIAPTTIVKPVRTTNRRIPMMKRKRMAAVMDDQSHNYSNDATRVGDDDNSKRRKDGPQRLVELKALRLERIQKRQAKYSNDSTIDLSDDKSDRSEELEMDDEPDQMLEDEHENVEDDVGNQQSVLMTTATISCPFCQQNIVVKDGQDSDAVLAWHLNHQCQQSPPSTRTTRSSQRQRTKVTYDSPSDAEDSGQVVTKRSSFKVNVAKVAPKSSQALDDMDDNDYDDRVDEWIVNGIRRMKHMKERDPNEVLPNEIEYDNHFYIPAWMNNHLFQYQRDGMEWMYQLHQQMTGGIIGDEMGLGKTVQVAAFLGAAAASRLLKSVLIVAPATILQHWLTELTIWAPGLRRILIHTSGGSLDRFDRSISSSLLQSLSKWLRKCRSHRVNEPIDDDDWDTMEPHSFCGTGYAIVTTYENLRRNAELYASHEWSYVVLDEAQKIRNPDADITLACKRIRTPHRLAMSGTPIQNDLRELWSLLDFVFPGRLGTLPTFEQEFAMPIKYGGYSNASPMQVQLAYRCAVMLRDMIEPFLLRRLKKDVKEVSRMPGKTEHVLFCRLSPRQRAMYEAYLKSDVVARVFRGNHMLLAAVTVLRKIANHPDLVCDPSDVALDNFIKNRGDTLEATNGDASDSDEYNIDDGCVGDEQSLLERSGKLDVLAKILPIWKKQGHRVLIFCQWRKMLDIIERFVRLQGWKFGRLDGNTNIASRQRLVDSFNTDESYFGMLCTTRTGGVGLNLIGANRIILYDPDWNPSGDAQARERAWRFGQVKEVTIYRLITAGTIEEKIYQRQIFKTAMTNKVLQDAKQRRLFSQRDLKDLFSLSADNGSIRAGGDGMTATSAITNGVGVVESADLEGKDSCDNEVALKKLMKSKGLAGVFDHHSLEPDHKRKSITIREMEEKAKKVAKEAARALKNSVLEHDPFTPTWTGSNETKPTMFGGSSSTTESFSSSNLLASIRQRNVDIELGGGPTTNSVRTTDPAIQKYAKLLQSLKDYVKRHGPSTEDILKEFENVVPDSDVAIFRRLLKSIATMQKGRWYLIDQ